MSWKRPRPPNETRRSADLTPAEQANARRAIRFLAKRFGTYAKLADAMGSKRPTVKAASGPRGRITAGLALRVARAAGVPLEDVLAGKFPPEGACPYCGRA